MPERPYQRSILFPLAAFVIVVGGMKIAAPLLVPLLLALFIVIIIEPPYEWLQDKGVPKWLASLSVLLVFGGAVFLVGSLIGSSAQEFLARLPHYQTRLRETTTGLLGYLNAWGISDPVQPHRQALRPQPGLGVGDQIVWRNAKPACQQFFHPHRRSVYLAGSAQHPRQVAHRPRLYQQPQRRRIPRPVPRRRPQCQPLHGHQKPAPVC